ncbi:MAG: ABC transporter ATP-binding protein [Promethearchaeota archaeon]
MINVKNLTKFYGNKLAVDNISFEVKKGEIVGLLGPNAAGKTTIMRILTGYLAPTMGDAFIAGYNMSTHSLEGRRHIGYLPEIIPLYNDMTVSSYLRFLTKLRGYPPPKIKSKVNDVIGICDLKEYANVYINKLSKGFRQRVGIAQAIVHEPDVLILDEPTAGIDPIQITSTRQLIKKLGSEHTIILSSHILPEVSTVCERVIIIHSGKIIAKDKIENLSSMLVDSKQIRIEVKGPPKQVLACLKEVKGVRRVAHEGDSIYIIEYPANSDVRSKINKATIKAGFALLGLEVVTMNLEDIFLKLTNEEPTK